MLGYVIIQPHMAAEVGAGRDEANRVNARVYEGREKRIVNAVRFSNLLRLQATRGNIL